MTMPPRLTLGLAVSAALVTGLWIWAWIGLQWTPAMPAAGPMAPLPVASRQADAAAAQPEQAVIDGTSLLQHPAFYPDRRPHRYRPDDPETAQAPPATLDFVVTSTVVGRRNAFAMLRAGGGTIVIARAGKPFEPDPAWRVTRIDKTSVSFTSPQGTPLTLTIAPPQPVPAVNPSTTPPNVSIAASPNAQVSAPAAAQAPAPATATQPVQDNMQLRARIEARRREAADRASGAGKD